MRRLTNGEQDKGAVAVLVGVLMLVLVLFVGVGVDLTSAYAKTQEIQNAADSAALAVAQTCAEDEASCGSEAGSNKPLSMEMANGNVRLEQGSLSTATDVNVAEGWVEVVASGNHANMFLGPLFPSFTVTESAKAAWVTPDAGPATLPLTISACNFLTQAGEPTLGTTFYLWVSKGKNTFVGDGCDQDYPPGGFGWLPADGECQTDVTLPEWMVVSDPGADRPSCVTTDLMDVGATFLIPIFTDYETTGTGNQGKYYLERFAAIRLLGYSFSEGGPTMSEPVVCPNSSKPNPASEYRNSCMHVEFVEWVELGDDYSGDDAHTEVSIVRLVD